MKYGLSALVVLAALSVSLSARAQTQSIESSLDTGDELYLTGGTECLDNDIYFRRIRV